MSFFRRRYGAHPLHLLVTVACLLVAAYAAQRIYVSTEDWWKIGLWFIGCVIGHDLVLWPLYALADSAVLRAARGRAALAQPPGWINYLRFPVLGSALLFVVWFPLIARRSRGIFEGTVGEGVNGYLGHWLIITAALFLISAVAYAVRIRRASMPRTTDPTPSTDQ